MLEKCEVPEISLTKEKFNLFIKNNLSRYSDEAYLYWDKIKFKEVPEGLRDNKELWSLVKFMRTRQYVTPVETESGESFTFSDLPFSKELLHEIDKHAS